MAEEGVQAGAAPGSEGGAPAPVAPQQPAASPWGELAPDVRGYVENKGWKTPADALQSYRNLEKLRGVPEDQLLRVPGADADPAAWDAIYSRLGRPENPADYGFEVPDGGVDLSELAHKAGLSKRQAQVLLEGVREAFQASQGKSDEEWARKSEQEMAQLREDWGKDYNAKMASAQNAVRALGWDGDVLDKLDRAMGGRWLTEHLERIGQNLGDHGGLLGERSAAGAFGMTREAAAARYEQLNSDPAFQARLQSPDRSVRMAAAEERAKVSRIAFGED